MGERPNSVITRPLLILRTETIFYTLESVSYLCSYQGLRPKKSRCKQHYGSYKRKEGEEGGWSTARHRLKVLVLAPERPRIVLAGVEQLAPAAIVHYSTLHLPKKDRPRKGSHKNGNDPVF
jgi:hypothetical protein